MAIEVETVILVTTFLFCKDDLSRQILFAVSAQITKKQHFFNYLFVFV